MDEATILGRSKCSLVLLVLRAMSVAAVLLLTCHALLADPTTERPTERPETELRAIAVQYAPIIFQEVDRGGRRLGHKPRGREDFIAAVDFDGDLKGANNWENQPLFPLLPVVYYSLVETQTPYFISYSVFHPRDWSRSGAGQRNMPYTEHENDMENIQVVVAKMGNWPPVLLLLSQTHLRSHFAAAKNVRIGAKKIAQLSPWPIVLFDNGFTASPTGTHVGIFIERKGHGIYSLGNGKKVRYKQKDGKIVRIEKKRAGSGRLIWEAFPIVQYVPGSNGPREPTIQLKKGMHQEFENEVPYALESIYHKFWSRFEAPAPYDHDVDWNLCGDGELFDGHFRYDDDLFEFRRVPRHFDSDKKSGPWKQDAGISPFAIGLTLNPLKNSEDRQIGQFFFNPATGYEKLFRFPGTWSKRYIYNPYLTSPLNMKRRK